MIPGKNRLVFSGDIFAKNLKSECDTSYFIISTETTFCIEDVHCFIDTNTCT